MEGGSWHQIQSSTSWKCSWEWLQTQGVSFTSVIIKIPPLPAPMPQRTEAEGSRGSRFRSSNISPGAASRMPLFRGGWDGRGPSVGRVALR